MRTLTINDAAKARVAEVIAFAERNHYYPSPDQPPPGDNPNFVAKLDTFRVVFTYTHADGMIYRHLSISVPGHKYAHPMAVFTIATLFGFTGWDGRTAELPWGWIGSVQEHDHCVVIAQPISREGGIPH